MLSHIVMWQLSLLMEIRWESLLHLGWTENQVAQSWTQVTSNFGQQCKYYENLTETPHLKVNGLKLDNDNTVD